MIPDDKIDFHEFGLLEPNQIVFITEKFINDSYSQDNKKLLIITGKGNLVRPLVKNILNTNKLVKNFKVASDSVGGAGAFEVWLKD